MISPESPGPVIWEDSFERADIREGWGAVHEVQSDHGARTSTAYARDGARSARFEVRDGDNAESSTDERQQLSDALMPDGGSFRPKEGDDLYIALSVYEPLGFPLREGCCTWQVILEFVSFDARGNGPAKLGHGSADGRFVFESVNTQDPPGGYYWVDDTLPPMGGWNDFVMHVRFSQNPAVGQLELWHKRPQDATYVKQTLLNGTTTQHYKTLLAPSAFLKPGLYRSHDFTQTGIVYLDRLKIGKAFIDVAL